MQDTKIEKLVDLIEEKRSLLEDVYAESSGGDRDKEAIENCLRKIVSAVIDIASRVIALKGFSRPDTYAGYFEVLAEEDVIDERLSRKLKEMAAFRNLLVHQYHRVSFDELSEIIESDIADVDEFIVSIQRFE